MSVQVGMAVGTRSRRSRTVYLSHGVDDVRFAAALVDFLEEVIPRADGRIECTSVPGYSVAAAADQGTRDDALVVGLWSEAAQSEVVADMVRAVDGGRSAMLLCDEPAAVELPESIAHVTRLQTRRRGLSDLMEDVAFALTALPRMGEASDGALSQLVLVVHRERALRVRENETPLFVVPPVDEPFADELPEPPLADPDSAPVRVREPATHAACCQAGALLAEALFHDTPLPAADVAAGGRLCRLHESLGGIPQRYPDAADLEAWQALFDGALAGLPPERRKLSLWFEVGFELSLATDLASCSSDGGDELARTAARTHAAEEVRRCTSELCIAAEVMQAVASELSSLPDLVGDAQQVAKGACVHILVDAARTHDAQREIARIERRRLHA